MKSIYYLLIGLILLCFTSCATTTMFTVYGEPGTQIMTPDRTTLATIDNTGNVSIENPDYKYYAFLLSHRPGTEEYIPFALDYRKKTYPGTKTFSVIGAGVLCTAAMTELGGLIALLISADFGLGVVGAGAAMLAVGAGIFTPAYSHHRQTNQQYSYKYISEQRTNQDIHYKMPDFKLHNIGTPVKQNVNVTKSSNNKTISGSSSTKPKKDKAAKIVITQIPQP